MSWIEAFNGWYVGNAEIIFEVSVVLFMASSVFNAHMTYKRLNNIQNSVGFLLTHSRELEFEVQRLKEISGRSSENYIDEVGRVSVNTKRRTKFVFDERTGDVLEVPDILNRPEAK